MVATLTMDDAREFNVAPPRSLEQRMTALDKANEIRFSRAALKDDIRALSYAEARLRVASLLEQSPAFLSTMRVEELLRAIPRFGDVKANRVLWAHQISPRKHVGGLTLRQREALAVVLRRPVPAGAGKERAA